MSFDLNRMRREAPYVLRGDMRPTDPWKEAIAWGNGLTGDKGSSNYGLVGSMVGLADAQRHDHRTYERLLDEFAIYVTKPLFHKELNSRNVYGSWIISGMEHGFSHAKAHGRHELAERIARNLRSIYAFMALGAAGKKGGRYPGFRVTMTGSRSAITNNSRNDTRVPISMLMDNPLDHKLGRMLGIVGRNVKIQDDHWEAQRRVLGVSAWDVFTDKQVVALRSVADGNEILLEYVLEMLGSGAKPGCAMRVRRTTEGSVSIIEDGMSPGSTPTLYGLAYFKKEITQSGYWNHVPWFDGHTLWLAVDNWTIRSHGKDGECALFPNVGEAVARRKATKDHWDEKTAKFQPSSKVMPIPGGGVLWDVRYSKAGVEVMEGNADPPDDPVDPPDDEVPPGGGWHTIKTDRAHLKFKTATAAEALAIIEGGGNHLPITKVALEPAELVQVGAELKRTLGV